MKKPKVIEKFQNFIDTRTDAEKAYTVGMMMLGIGMLAAKTGEAFDRYNYEDEVIDVTDSAVIEEE